MERKEKANFHQLNVKQLREEMKSKLGFTDAELFTFFNTVILC
jgi:hypothetical protein